MYFVTRRTRFRLLLALAAPLLLAGCPTWTNHEAQVGLGLGEKNGWLWQEGNLTAEVGAMTYRLEVHDRGPNNQKVYKIPGLYFVQILGQTFGCAVKPDAPRMLYDPREAYLEINGKRIAALPEMWIRPFQKALETNEPPLVKNASALPVDVNCKQAARHYIVFPMDDPVAGRDTFSMDPGTILLDGVRTRLPTFRSFYTPFSRHYEFVSPVPLPVK